MFHNKGSFVPVMLVLTSFLCAYAAKAQDATCPFTAASLQGSYGMVGYYSGGIALALAVENFDDSGNMTRKAFVNAPPAATAPTGAPRTITPTTSTGTFTVNCDGTGTYTRMLTNVTTGVTSGPFTGNFVITGAVAKDGQLIATTFTDAQVEGSLIVPGGVFVYYVHTRLQDAPAAPSSNATSTRSVKKGT
jgi:hypothetical protein